MATTPASMQQLVNQLAACLLADNEDTTNVYAAVEAVATALYVRTTGARANATQLAPS